MNIKFDITNEPPSTDALADARREAASTLKLIELRKRAYLFMYVMTGLVMLAVLLQAWHSNLIAGEELLAALAIAIFLAGAGIYDHFLGVALGICVAVMGFTTGAIAIGLVPAAGVAVLLGISFNKRQITVPGQEARKTLDQLVELESSSLPDQCIQFMRFVDSDETIKAYHSQVAAMGRRPVVGEYRAAEAWFYSRDSRMKEQEKMAQAREACARMVATA